MKQLCRNGDVGINKDEKENQERIYYLDNLKFILITLVVVGHFGLKMIFVKEIKYLICTIYLFHMPCFVFVSGFLAKKINKNGKLRVDAILCAFWMYLLFKFINFSLGLVSHNTVTLNLFVDASASWYLLALCIWYLLIPFIERIKVKYMIIGSFLFSLLIGYELNVNHTLALSRVFVFFPFFLLGFYTSKEKLNQFLDRRKVIVSLILLICPFILMSIFWLPFKQIHKVIYASLSYWEIFGVLAPYGFLIRAAWYIVALILSGAFMMLIPRRKLFFTKFGERTMQVYILHAFIRTILVGLDVFKYIQKVRGCLPYLVLAGSVVLTFLLSNIWLKKLFDIISLKKLFKKLIKTD